MSIWYKEVIRVNGDIKAYIEIQNEYTGSISCGIREIHLDGNQRYCRADGQKINVQTQYENLLRHEDRVRQGLKLLDSNSWINGR